MRTALVPMLAVLLAVALSLQASAQTGSKRRLFTNADYDTFFSEGSRRFETAERRGQGIEQRHMVKGVYSLTVTEVMPKWNPASLYRYLKIRMTTTNRAGVWNKTLKSRVYEATEIDFEEYKTSNVWLSNNNRIEISPEDASIGSVVGYYRVLARARGADPAAVEQTYRGFILGKWSVRCEYLEDETFDVECVQTKLATGEAIVRRYFKQNNLS